MYLRFGETQENHDVYPILQEGYRNTWTGLKVRALRVLRGVRLRHAQPPQAMMARAGV